MRVVGRGMQICGFRFLRGEIQLLENLVYGAPEAILGLGQTTANRGNGGQMTSHVLVSGGIERDRFGLSL